MSLPIGPRLARLSSVATGNTACLRVDDIYASESAFEMRSSGSLNSRLGSVIQTIAVAATTLCLRNWMVAFQHQAARTVMSMPTSAHTSCFSRKSRTLRFAFTVGHTPPYILRLVVSNRPLFRQTFVLFVDCSNPQLRLNSLSSICTAARTGSVLT